MCNSTAFQCHNLTTEQCSALAIATGTTDVIIAAVSLSILLFVPFRMKRDACDSPTKRASLVLSLVLIISSLNLASAEFYNGFLPFGVCELMHFVYFSTRMAIFLYMVTIVGMLLIQVYSTVIYSCCNSMRKRLVIVEVAIHIIITVLSVVFSTGEEFFDSTNDLCLDRICSSHFDGTIVAYVILSLVVFILLCTVLSLVYVYVRYWKTVGIASRVRWTLLRCCIMLGILVADLAIELLFYWIDQGEEYTSIVVGEITINSSLLEISFLLLLTTLLFFPRSKCVKYNSQRTPLLARSNLQCTNPPSLQDQANVPSYTVFSPPPEMSDYYRD